MECIIKKTYLVETVQMYSNSHIDHAFVMLLDEIFCVFLKIFLVALAGINRKSSFALEFHKL